MEDIKKRNKEIKDKNIEKRIKITGKKEKRKNYNRIKYIAYILKYR